MRRSYHTFKLPPHYENGIYINCVNDSIITSTQFIKGGYPTSFGKTVVIIFDDVMIELYPYEIRDKWSSNVSTLIPGVTVTKNENIALNDFNGLVNSLNVIKVLNEGLIADAPIFEYANNLSEFYYVPSLGELTLAEIHIEEINVCLQLIGGNRLDFSNRYWTSTQYGDENNPNTAWVIWNHPTFGLINTYSSKYDIIPCRFIKKFN